jgi:hypothetical protein
MTNLDFDMPQNQSSTIKVIGVGGGGSNAWYIGIENALNYTQKNPIRSVDNPFSEDFDAAMIWGPVMGRKVYSGIRVKFND